MASVETEPEAEVVDERLLYQPVQQVDGVPEMPTEWVMVTPDMAQEWLDKAEEQNSFKQRKTKPRTVRRYQILMETERFVNYLPNGPLCFDEQDVLLNGKHRLTALASQKRSFGFLVIKNVPRFMFSFFDTGLPRSLGDVFHITGAANKAQLGSALRLGMRYEEMLKGARGEIGWREWGSQRDEHADVMEFLERRTELADWFYVGDQIYKGCRLIVSAGIVFRFYQSLTWPDGEEKIIEFCDGLARGAMLSKGSPTLVLREWARDEQQYINFRQGKRELHLVLLFNHFAEFVQGRKMTRVTWARGLPMPVPYHPKGPDVARQTLTAALAEVDKAAWQEKFG